VIAVWVAILVFCASNRFSHLQAATGFRYLAPLVPLVFLALSDHLARLPRAALAAISVPAIVHSWVLTVFREPVGKSWHMFFDEGITLPWLRVLRMTSPSGSPVQHPLLPIALLGGCGVAIALMWWYGGRLAARRRPA